MLLFNSILNWDRLKAQISLIKRTQCASQNRNMFSTNSSKPNVAFRVKHNKFTKHHVEQPRRRLQTPEMKVKLFVLPRSQNQNLPAFFQKIIVSKNIWKLTETSLRDTSSGRIDIVAKIEGHTVPVNERKIAEEWECRRHCGRAKKSKIRQ